MWKEPEEQSLEIYLRQLRNISSEEALSAEEERQLIQRAQAGNRDALEKLVQHFLPYVYHIALKYRGRGVPLADLISEGNVGLLQAIQRYNPEKNTRLSTYARWWIMKQITTALRKNHLIPLSDAALRAQKTLNDVLQQFMEEDDRIPTLDELAERANVSREQAEDALSPLTIFSLDEPPGESQARKLEELLFSIHSPTPERMYREEYLHTVLREAVNHLPHRERQILILYYGLDNNPTHTLDQIGKIMGLTRERIRFMKKRALNRLASMLGRSFWQAYHEFRSSSD